MTDDRKVSIERLRELAQHRSYMPHWDLFTEIAVLLERDAAVLEALTSDDGPVLLTLREAIGDELEESEDIRNSEGEELIPNDPLSERIAQAVSDQVKAALQHAQEQVGEGD